MKHIVVRLLAIFVILATSGAVATAQQPKKVHRIGYLSNTNPSSDLFRSGPFRASLRKLGYVEGENIGIEYRYGEGKSDRASGLAAELVDRKVDLIVVSGGELWVREAKNATKTIPIIMMGVGIDPVKGGLVESLARPGGNVTGVTNLGPELGGKRLELLKKPFPNFFVSRLFTIRPFRALYWRRHRFFRQRRVRSD